MRSAVLQVPGARLYYEVRGHGPVLLMIHAGGASARSLNGIAERLDDQFTVVTYDRRGLARSTLDDPDAEQRVETHSDDAKCLLDLLSPDPAYVFATSGGAVIALDLVARNPGRLRTLVAHDPPARYLLEDNAPSRGEALAVYRRDGVEAATRLLFARIGQRKGGAANPGTLMPRSLSDRTFLFEQELPMYGRYRLDVPVLQEAAHVTRIVLAGADTNREHVGYRSAAALAACLGTTLVGFPGDHAGYVSQAQVLAPVSRKKMAATSSWIRTASKGAFPTPRPRHPTWTGRADVRHEAGDAGRPRFIVGGWTLYSRQARR